MNNKIIGVDIDIERMTAKKLQLQKDHVSIHKKDESAKIKLRKLNSKIKKLTAYKSK